MSTAEVVRNAVCTLLTSHAIMQRGKKIRTDSNEHSGISAKENRSLPMNHPQGLVKRRSSPSLSPSKQHLSRNWDSVKIRLSIFGTR